MFGINTTESSAPINIPLSITGNSIDINGIPLIFLSLNLYVPYKAIVVASVPTKTSKNPNRFTPVIAPIKFVRKQPNITP